MNRRLPHSFARSLPGRRGTILRNRPICPKAILLAVLCVGFACSLAACRGDHRESVYASLSDADKDGAINRGWIPEFLPSSSRAIHEVHGVSQPTEWCTFEFLASDSQGLRQNFKSVEVLPLSVRRVPSPGVSWWPTVLEGTLDTEKIRQTGFDLYVVEKPETSVTKSILLFAVDWHKGRALFYGTRE